MERNHFMNKFYTLGLDLGISSIGWCLYEGDECYYIDDDGVIQTDKNNAPIVTHNLKRIVDLGSFVFSELEDGKTGKTENYKRGILRRMRRQRRRRVHRLERLRNFFKEKFGKENDSFDFLKDVIAKRNSITLLTPFELKIKGLSEKLSKEELMIVLYHYMKYRGFKSNRKSAERENTDNKKLLSKIEGTKKELDSKKITITKYLINEQKKLAGEYHLNNARYARIHNSGSDDDFFFIDRNTYLEEINQLLEKQIEYEVIDEQFKDEYIKLYEQQRSFSSGPNETYSKYKVDFDKLRGYCIFDNEKRAVKDSITARRFILLSALNNFRYIDNDVEKHLTSKQIQDAENAIIKKKECKYSQLLTLLGITNVEIPSLTLTKKTYKKVISDYAKEKNLTLPIEDSQYLDELGKRINDKKLDNIFFKNSDLVYKIANSKNKCFDKYKTEDKFYDTIADILFSAKDDDRIREKLKKTKYSDDIIIDALLDLNIDSKQTINLSDSICKKINPLLEEGKRYDEALKELGYSHTKKYDSEKSQQEIPPIDDALKEMNITLTNPVVKNTLINMRKIINALLQKYGHIDECVIEMTRELKKPFEERKEIRDSQLENYENNIRLKGQLLEKHPQLTSISKDDLLKYRLFEEQKHICVYSGEKIEESKLFDKDYVEIDHILPYSRSFDDSYNNKVLVLTEKNRAKGNRLPSEVDSKVSDLYEHVKDFLCKNKSYPSKKRQNLLCTEIPSGFIGRNLTDTSYITNIAKKLITYYVVDKDTKCRTTNGQITSLLKKQWGLSGKTHTYALCGNGKPVSYENGCYQAKFNYDYKFNNVEIKEKELVFHFKVRQIVGERIEESDFPISIKLKAKNNGKELSLNDKNCNDSIEDFINMYESLYKKFFVECKDKQIDEIFSLIKGSHQSLQYSTEEYSAHIEHLIYLLSKVLSEIQKDIDAKNRDNDLHHALDAAVIGAVTTAIYQKISSANKKNMVDDLLFDPPYKDFQCEVLARVYEHDENKLLEILNSLKPYKENKLDKHDVHVLIPARQPKTNVGGAISKETILGVDKLNTKKAVKTISVFDIEKDNKKDNKKNNTLESIIHKEKGQGNYAVYKAIKKWLEIPKAERKGKYEYPILEKKGTLIKSVKIYCGDVRGKVSLSQNQNRFAENSDVMRVEFYKKKDNSSDNLYAVPIYYHHIFKRRKILKEKKKEAITYNLMWASGDNGSKQISSDELNQYYKLIAVLPRNSLIEIELKDDSNSLVYSAGLTDGKFEIYSLLGDDMDLCRNLKRKSKTQFCISISSIKSIKVRSISVLGIVS